MANNEAFRWNFSSSTNSEIGRSVLVTVVTFRAWPANSSSFQNLIWHENQTQKIVFAPLEKISDPIQHPWLDQFMDWISHERRFKDDLLWPLITSVSRSYACLFLDEKWGIWKQGISCEENRREKRENEIPKIKHFGSFWRRKW